MIQHTHGMHHLQKRKRIHLKGEPYPHPDPLRRFMDRFIYVVGFIGPILTIPQILQIWLSRSAQGVNIITWSTYVFTASMWTWYAILHKEKALIYTSIAWIVINALVVIGVIAYG